MARELNGWGPRAGPFLKNLKIFPSLFPPAQTPVFAHDQKSKCDILIIFSFCHFSVAALSQTPKPFPPFPSLSPQSSLLFKNLSRFTNHYPSRKKSETSRRPATSPFVNRQSSPLLSSRLSSINHSCLSCRLSFPVSPSALRFSLQASICFPHFSLALRFKSVINSPSPSFAIRHACSERRRRAR